MVHNTRPPNRVSSSTSRVVYRYRVSSSSRILNLTLLTELPRSAQDQLRLLPVVPAQRNSQLQQARLINKIAKDWEILDHVRTSTVHRFQGGEELIIIFDTVEGSGTKVAPMLDDKHPDSEARLLLNVALTRAQNRFYLVGHTKHLLSDLHNDSFLSKIIRHFYGSAQKIASESLVDSYFTNDFEKWADTLLSNIKNYDPAYGHLYTEKIFGLTSFKI